MTNRLIGKVALVTGASSGIGRATALAYAAEGAMVAAVARRGAELDATVDAITRRGGRAIAVQADVTHEAAVAAAVDQVARSYDRLDVAFHAAGGTHPSGLVHELDAAAFRDWLDGHLVSAFLVTKHAVRAMGRTGGGSVIHVGTFVGQTMALPGTAGYAAAKAGLLGLVRTAAVEGAADGVRVNAIVSGGVDTPMFRLWNATDEARAAAAALHPMRRVARPEEIAAAGVFLAAEEASFVTGAAIAVDGGVGLV